MDIAGVHKNSKLLIDGVPYDVVDVDFVKPGKGRAIYRLRLKNLVDGNTLDRTYHSSESVEEARISTEEMQYLYRDGDHYVFMNTETFEQLPLSAERLGDKSHFLKEGTTVTVMMLDDKPLDVIIPVFVELAVVETAATTRKETITAQNKSAVLETGYAIDVPTFIKEGDILKIDTRTGNYVERAGPKK
ncbi:MAG: elongation factor P [Chloroflexota bacterium]